jgi:hypothetical protein
VRPHALEHIPPEEVKLFWNVWNTVMLSPDHLDLGKDDEGQDVELSCHILARAISRLFPSLRFADGTYLHGYNHSWLVTPSGHIIDIYPVAGASGPELKDGNHPSPAYHLYREMSVKDCHRRYDELFNKAWFQRAIGLTTRALRQALKKHRRTLRGRAALSSEVRILRNEELCIMGF